MSGRHPAEDRQGDDDGEDVPTRTDEHEDDENPWEPRHREERVEDPHHQLVQLSPREARDGAVDEPEEENDPDRHEGNEHRVPPAERHPLEQVAAEEIGAEQVLGAREAELVAEVDGVGVVWREEGCEQAEEHQRAEPGGTPDGCAVAAEATVGRFHALFSRSRRSSMAAATSARRLAKMTITARATVRPITIG
jgi:hypothetical protein